MYMIAVGQPYPSQVPEEQGPSFQLNADGELSLYLQYPDIHPQELKALQTPGPIRYSLCFSPTPPHVLFWVFEFPHPIHYLETPFHGGVYEDDRIQKLINDTERNALIIYVLDRQIVKGIRAVGLDYDAMRLFRTSLALQPKISQEEYRQAVTKVWDTHGSEELFKMGVQFKTDGNKGERGC